MAQKILETTIFTFIFFIFICNSKLKIFVLYLNGSLSYIAHVVKYSTFQKGRIKEGKESRIKIPVRTVYYIITEVFSYKNAMVH